MQHGHNKVFLRDSLIVRLLSNLIVNRRDNVWIVILKRGEGSVAIVQSKMTLRVKYKIVGLLCSILGN